MSKRFAIHPANPHRVCWGCDRYCPADDMACGNGADRTQHPEELLGPDWHTWGLDAVTPADPPAATADLASSKPLA